MALPRKRFDGAINGKTIKSFLQQLDYNLPLEERKVFLNKLLQTQCNGMCVDEFFETYYSKFFNPHISCAQPLCGDSNISRALEQMANYLLFAPDAPWKQKKVGILSKGKQKEVKRKEISLDSLLEKAQDSGMAITGICDFDGSLFEENWVEELVRNKPNYKKENKGKIYKADLQNPELNCVLQYQNMIDVLYSKKKEWEQLHPEKYRKYKHKLQKWLSDCKYDQILAKELTLKPIRWKQPMTDSTEPDWLDVMPESLEATRELMQLTDKNLLHDAGLIKYDLKQVIDMIPLSDTEKKIVEGISGNSMTQEAIGIKLKISQQAVGQYIDKIAIKIMDKYFELWEYYANLNFIYGKYKTCSKCRQVKLANERFFRKESKVKDGLRAVCKECSK